PGRRRHDAGSGPCGRNADVLGDPRTRRSRYGCPRQERRLRRARRQSPRRHHEHEKNREGLSARQGGRSGEAESEMDGWRNRELRPVILQSLIKAAIVTEKLNCEAVEDRYKRGLKPATTYYDNVAA